MEPYFPVIALLMALGIAWGLGYWAAFGGWIGRWVAAGLLVWWIVWVGEVTIRNTYPRWLYTPEERVYMDRLASAIEAGRTRVPLRELVPFEWSFVCFIDADYRGVLPEELKETEDLMQDNVTLDLGSHWLDSISFDYTELFLVFDTKKGVTVIKDRTGVFSDLIPIKGASQWEPQAEIVGHWVTYDHEHLNKASNWRVCYGNKDKVEVVIEKIE